MIRRCAILGLLLAGVLALLLKPAREWRVDPVNGRIVLDAEELGRPKYPHLVRWLNAVAKWYGLRELIQIDEAFLMRRAEQAARSYLGDMYFDTGGKTMPRLLVGEDDGLQGLRALLQDLANDGDGADASSFATQSAFGRLATQQQIIKSLQIQMMAAALLDHPGTGAGIRREQVRRPIIIVGPPRTGTTFLHRAIARHPQVQYLPYFEALETIAQPSKKQVNRNDDPRIARTDGAIFAIHHLRPLFSKLMVMGSHVPFEEMQLSGHCFSSLLWESSIGSTPRYSEWYRRSPQLFGYDCIHKFLKILQFQRRGKTNNGEERTWVLKTPQHTLQLPAIKKVFPDAVVVLTWRDPVAILKSLLPLLAYSLGVQNDWIDLKAFGSAWVDRLKRIIEHQEHDGKRLFPEAIEADFDRIVGRHGGGTIALIREILEKAGLSVSEDDMSPIHRFVENERIGKMGGSRTLFDYDLGVFGLDEAELVEDFMDYGS